MNEINTVLQSYQSIGEFTRMENKRFPQKCLMQGDVFS